MRNGIQAQLKVSSFTRVMIALIICFTSLPGWSADQIDLPIPAALTQYFESNPASNLELVIEMDRMESKQDSALASLFQKTKNLGEDKLLGPEDFHALEETFLNELNEKVKTYKNAYIAIEGQRLYADFLLRLSLAAMPEKTLANQFLKKSKSYVDSVHGELQKRGSEWTEKETPQILSRLTVTELSLLNVKRLLTQMSKNDFLTQSTAITESLLDLKPGEISELEILTAHAESMLYAQESEVLEPKTFLNILPKHQTHFKDTLSRIEGLEKTLSQRKNGGIRRILAIEKAKTVQKIASLYLISPSDFLDSFKKLADSLNTSTGIEKRSTKDALQYLYSINELTGLTLPLGKLLGKEQEVKLLIHKFEEEFVKNMGKEFYEKSLWPSFDRIFSTLDPTSNVQGQYTHWALQEYINKIYALSNTFIQSKQDPKSVSSETFQSTMETADRAWAYLQCGFVFNGIDRFNGNLTVRSPLTKMKFNFAICRNSSPEFKFINTLATKMQIDQIDRAKNVELALLGAGFTIDVALAITTLGAGNAAKKGLQSVSMGVFRSVTRKLVVSAAGRIAMKVSQRIAVAIVADVIVSTGHGLKSFTFEAIRGRVDMDNLKDNPYFDKDIGPVKHLARLFATSLAGFGMDKTWRVLSNAGLQKFIEPNSPLLKLVSNYATTTVNSTVAKVTSAMVDLPFEGKAALSKVSNIFSFETLVLGNAQSTAMGRIANAKGLSSAGLSSKFMIRMSDRKLSSDETTVLDSATRSTHN